MRLNHLFLIVLIASVGCRGPKFAANNVVEGSIPSDITNSKYVLLVQEDEHGSPNLLEKSMKKYYPAAYEIVRADQLKSDKKYSDVEKYRYVVAVRYGSGGIYKQVYRTPKEAIEKVSGPSKVAYSDQVVFDRKENKEFPATNLMGHNFAQGMMLFSQAITHKK